MVSSSQQAYISWWRKHAKNTAIFCTRSKSIRFNLLVAIVLDYA